MILSYRCTAPTSPHIHYYMHLGLKADMYTDIRGLSIGNLRYYGLSDYNNPLSGGSTSTSDTSELHNPIQLLEKL